MVKKFILTIGITLLCCASAFSGVKINEVCTANLSSHMNKGTYNFSNYIELDTEGDSINLNGLMMVHYGKRAVKGKLEEKWRWRITKDWIAGPHAVIWMDESTLAGHSPYKLDADGGSIVIFDGDVKIDSFAYESMDVNLSYGYKEGVLGYMIPTPERENLTAYSNYTTARCPAPQYSHKGGILAEPIELTIDTLPQSSVYYTLDGSTPSRTHGTRYKGAIYIGSNTNVRSIAYQSEKIPSKVSTVSFIFEDEIHEANGGFTIPVISVSVDSSYFYDDTIGMCVIGINGIRGEKSCTSTKANYNRDWKRPIHFEYIVDGETVVSQEAEAAVEGGCSRTSKIKSISVKATKRTGIDTFGYHFFQSKPNVTHRALHIRNGGTAYDKVRFRDGLMQTFATGMEIDYQAYQPVAYYINGVYQGLMNLNERTNSDYIEANHGDEEDDIDLITVSDQLGIRASKGDLDGYNDLVKHIRSTQVDSVLYYDGANNRMDMNEYVDYQIIQQFIVNTDWPGNNTKIWRNKKKNGKFRWMLFDTDFGFGLPGYEYLGTYTKNMIKWCAGEGGTQWANNRYWMTEIFKGLKYNYFFERKFTTRFLIQLSTSFTTENITTVFDSVTAIVNPEYHVTFNKSAVDAAASMRKFALNRPDNIYKHLQSYVGGKSITTLEISSELPTAQIFFNGESISHYNGKYFTGYELELIAVAPEGYQFAGWKFSQDSSFVEKQDTTDSRYGLEGIWVGEMKKAGAVTATFRITEEDTTDTPTDSLPALVLNEVCNYANGLSQNPDANGEYSTWIELFNNGEKNINLAGYSLTLSRGDSIIAKSTLPTGYNQLTLGAKRHKLLWANGDSTQGATYLNFSIARDTLSRLCITNERNEEIDCIDLVSTLVNESYGRESDGAVDWVIFTTDPLEHNPSPRKKNGVKDTTGVNDQYGEPLTLLLYPNPASNEAIIASQESMEQIIVLDMTGRIIYREEPKAQESHLPTAHWEHGIYLVKVVTKKAAQTVRLIKGGD